MSLFLACTIIVIVLVFIAALLRKLLKRRTLTYLPELERMIHVLYINMDQDTQRREKYISFMPLACPEHISIERVQGVSHSWGLEGCRLAHLRALSRALELNQRYVMITEDDIMSSEVGLPLQSCLSEFFSKVEALDDDRAPVLLLLECGSDLESKIALRECRGGAHFRRAIFFGNNSGAYLVRKDFIPTLSMLWKAARGIHVDHSWQLLWPFNEVWMAFPPPLKQATVWSHNLKDIREESRAFDVDTYYEKNRHL